MNRSLASSNAVRLAAESMPAPGDHHELLDTVSGLERLHDGNDRGGLSLVPLPAADLERETGPVDQQSDDDLSSPGFCGGWFIWCRWLPVVIVPGGGGRVPRQFRARRGLACR